MWRNDVFRLKFILSSVLLFQWMAATAHAYYIMRNGDSYIWITAGSGPSLALSPEEGKAAFDRIMAWAQVTLDHLGPAGDQSLIPDQVDVVRLFAFLGAAPKVHMPGEIVDRYGYVSSIPGDMTVLLVMVDNCPGPCERVFDLELRRDPGSFPKPGSLQPTPGLSAAVATKSGLRLGLTKDEVKAILGWPQHEEENVLYYGAARNASFSKEEVLARGFPEKYVRMGQYIDRFIKVIFTNGRADSIRLDHRTVWD